MNGKLIAGALLCAIAFLLQVRFWGSGIGFENTVFVTLIVLAFALDVFQIALLGVAAAWLLNWQPGMSVEVVLLAAIPVLVSLCKGIFPGLFLVGYWGAVILGVGAWYVAADFRFVTEVAPALMREIALSLVWAAACIIPVRILSRDLS